MPSRESVETLLAEISRSREEAEAEAARAAESLVRLASGITPLLETDCEQIRAACDSYLDAVGRCRMLSGLARKVRALLM